MLNAKLEESGYVATVEDVQEIAREALEATEHASGSRMTYLRVLVGTTQNELGIPQTARRTKARAPTPEETRKQLEALEAVQERFYRVIRQAVEGPPLTEDERSMEPRVAYDRRAGFARSAKATLKAWIASGNTLKAIVPAQVTKYGLQQDIAKREPGDKRAPSEKRVLKLTGKLVDRIMDAPPAQALALLEVAIARLSDALREVGRVKLDVAVKEHMVVAH
jgi:hypothetical protein